MTSARWFNDDENSDAMHTNRAAQAQPPPAMITLRRSSERGQADHGWLKAAHTFSFADYHDPRFMGFRSLRVINDDIVAGGGGFGMHPHRDMEIVTYVIRGALHHRDSMGHSAIMRAGDVQRITAGTGIEHSEVNASPIEPVRLLQIWIRPNRRGAAPSYAERSFGGAEPGRWHLIASGTGREGSLVIQQDAEVHLGRLDAGTTLTHSFEPGRGGWVQVAEGRVLLNGQKLEEGDGAALENERELSLTSHGASQVLLFDLA